MVDKLSQAGTDLTSNKRAGTAPETNAPPVPSVATVSAATEDKPKVTDRKYEHLY